MSDLGEVLRTAREKRGYTLDDVQEITKIRKRYLEAIETGDYKILPGSFYVRAFVKTYAETVGLDAEEVLRLYQQELPKATAPETVLVQPQIKSSSRSVQHSDRWGKAAVSLLMWAFPILIAVVIYVYYINTKSAEPNELAPQTPPISSDTGTPTPSPTASAAPSPSPTESASPSLTPNSTVTVSFKETRGSTRYYEISPEGGHKLEIDITGRCWVEVRDGGRSGKKLHYASVDTPQTLSFDVPGVFYISIGRSDLATVKIDGVPVDDGDKANRSRLLFTPVAAAPAQ
ncbi:RodZ domain-containing protein [Cohnella kolymensis]|uniref:RodZ domain-containing protein n=1 Tax=Cohnella kolymensis TaxID=1590652 RepID=UPI000697189F|nr:RodZ domain-containing protein [Cohnella kolymensis]